MSSFAEDAFHCFTLCGICGAGGNFCSRRRHLVVGQNKKKTKNAKRKNEKNAIAISVSCFIVSFLAAHK